MNICLKNSYMLHETLARLLTQAAADISICSACCGHYDHSLSSLTVIANYEVEDDDEGVDFQSISHTLPMDHVLDLKKRAFIKPSSTIACDGFSPIPGIPLLSTVGGEL